MTWCWPASVITKVRIRPRSSFCPANCLRNALRSWLPQSNTVLSCLRDRASTSACIHCPFVSSSRPAQRLIGLAICVVQHLQEDVAISVREPPYGFLLQYSLGPVVQSRDREVRYTLPICCCRLLDGRLDIARQPEVQPDFLSFALFRTSHGSSLLVPPELKEQCNTLYGRLPHALGTRPKRSSTSL